MNIVFSRHARLKLEQRRIPAQVVLGAVRFPDVRMPGRNSREELYKAFRGIYLKVVIKELPLKTIVITAHLIAKLKNQ